MKHLITSILLVCTSLLFSQVALKGTVIDNSQPVSWANVAITQGDGKIITGSITDESGAFNLQVKPGEYYVNISFMGYVNFEKQITLIKNLDLGTITLKEDSKSLDEIVITHRKKIIEQKPDRLIFNVEHSVIAMGGDALDALSLAPGLKVQNGSINLLGRGESRVMINGRLLQLTGDNLVTYLGAIASDNIKKIEVISTPPAKFEAEGNGGLINIILKKGQLNSWKNTVSLVHNMNTYYFMTLRNSLLINKDKLSVSLNVNGTRGNSRNTEEFQVFYPSNTWDINIDSKDSQDNLSAQLLIDYDITPKTTIGLQYLGNSKTPDLTDVSVSKIFNATSML